MKLDSKHLQDIARAVHEAEQHTNGEIVVYMVNRSERYSWLYAKVAALSLFLGYTFTLIESKLWLPFPDAVLVVFPLLLTLALLMLTRSVPAFQKVFIGDEEMDKAVANRACKAFVSEEVFKTSERSGILVFISLFEQEVLVIGDTGINAKVSTEKWHSVVKTITHGIKKNQFAEALRSAILECGELLKQSGLTLSPNDKNELSNELRYFNE